MPEKKDYTPPEIYEGYYWLVLHTDPVHAPDGGRGDGCVIPDKYWGKAKPDWVKTEYPNSGINHWFAPEGIPLFKVGGKEIRSWRDMKILWGDVKIEGTANRLYDRTPPDEAEQSPTTLLDEAELWLNLRPKLTSDDFYRLCGDEILQAIESYLKPQHKKNLKELEEAEKAQKTSLLIRITPTSPARVVGLLASIVTLIMFVYWLLGKL